MEARQNNKGGVQSQESLSQPLHTCIWNVLCCKNCDCFCTDINECAEFSPCEQKCVNVEGSFECSCNDGFDFKEDSTCQGTVLQYWLV